MGDQAVVLTPFHKVNGGDGASEGEERLEGDHGECEWAVDERRRLQRGEGDEGRGAR